MIQRSCGGGSIFFLCWIVPSRGSPEFFRAYINCIEFLVEGRVVFWVKKCEGCVRGILDGVGFKVADVVTK